MELSPFQRFASFAVIVIVLVGLGVYLFLPAASQASGPSGARGGTVTPGAAGGRSAGSPTPSPGQAQAPDIYQWLPFTQADLASAAEVVVKFGDDYASYSYSESTASYLAPLRPLASAQLVALVGRAYATPGLVATRVSGKQSATASTAILLLRAFGSTSLTFVVAITEQTTGSAGAGRQVADYSVTLTGSGTAWQVSDVEPASAGNQ